MFLTYFEKIFYQRTTGTEKFFLHFMLLKKTSKFFNWFLELKIKRKFFFYESKARNEWQNAQIIKKTQFGTFANIAFIIFLRPKNSAEFFLIKFCIFFRQFIQFFCFFGSGSIECHNMLRTSSYMHKMKDQTLWVHQAQYKVTSTQLLGYWFFFVFFWKFKMCFSRIDHYIALISSCIPIFYYKLTKIMLN